MDWSVRRLLLLGFFSFLMIQLSLGEETTESLSSETSTEPLEEVTTAGVDAEVNSTDASEPETTIAGSTECEDEATKRFNATACAGDDFDQIVQNITVEDVTQCSDLEAVHDCMNDIVEDCAKLVEEFDKWWVDRPTARVALDTCNISMQLGATTETPESVTESASMTEGSIALLLLLTIVALVQ